MFFRSFFFLTYAWTIIAVASKCPDGTVPSYTDPNRCLYFGIEMLPYFYAEKECQTLGGHLTTTHTIGEDMDLIEKVEQIFKKSNDFWFGANKINGKWEWIDGSDFSFADWASNEPNNEPENICGALSMIFGKWFADDCFYPKPFVCEFFVESDETTTTTSSSTITTEETTTTPSTTTTPEPTTPRTTPSTTSTQTTSTSTTEEPSTTPTTPTTTPTTSSTTFTPEPTITSSCGRLSKTTSSYCSTTCVGSCGERLRRRAMEVCSSSTSIFNPHPIDCTDDVLEKLCCFQQCTDCDIKACRCPDLY